ncbi:MAG: bile acid:sodium symporter [Verrucomicrobiota bacterium]
MEALTQITKLTALVFFMSSMAGIGLGLTWPQITAPLRKAGFVARALLANFVIAPLLAVVIAKVLRLDEPFATGLLLLGLGAGAPFMPKVVGMAKGDLAQAVALMVLSMVSTIVLLPLVLPLLVKGVEVDPWKIAQFLVMLLLLPLIAGLVIKSRQEAAATRLRPVLERISSLALLVMLILILTIHFKSVLRLFGTGAIAAAVLFSVLTALAGWWLGGRNTAQKTVLCMGTGLRNIPAALVVSVQNFKNPDVPVMILVTTVMGILILVPTALRLGKRARPTGDPD